MNLTKEDIEAIKSLIADNNEVLEKKLESKLDQNLERLEVKIDEKLERLDARFEEKLASAVRQILSAHVRIVNDMEKIEGNNELILSYLNLSPRSRALQQMLQETKEALGVD